jgi:hypothetical protein
MLTEKEIEIFLKEQNIFYKIEVKEEERAIILKTGDNDFSDGEIQIVLENNKINFVRVDYGFIRFIETIDNNIIEFKHYLQNHKKDIKITKQDMIDWLNTFTTEYNSSYHIYTKTNPCLYVYTSLEDIDGKKKKCFGLLARQYIEEVNIFQAKNSQEYWRLYNIIKNLKAY